MLTKSGLVGSSLLPFKGLTGSGTLCIKIDPKLRNINIPHYNIIFQPNIVFLEVPHFHAKERFKFKCYLLKLDLNKNINLPVYDTIFLTKYGFVGSS